MAYGDSTGPGGVRLMNSTDITCSVCVAELSVRADGTFCMWMTLTRLRGHSRLCNSLVTGRTCSFRNSVRSGLDTHSPMLGKTHRIHKGQTANETTCPPPCGPGEGFTCGQLPSCSR